MPTPILKIPIDDSAFQRYLATFAKYQEQVKAQPEMWAGLNDSMGALAVAGAAVAAEIAHQSEETRKLAAEEAKREGVQKKAAKEKADADKGEKAREKEAADRRKDAIRQVKEYSRSLADAAVTLGKWALIGEGAGLAAGALSLWGLDKLVGGVGEERRAAQGAGVSIGARQGAGLYLQRYFDTNSTLSKIADMQQTPGDWGTFRMLGVDPTGKNPAALMGEMALAARRLFVQDRGNLALADAQGLTKVFSPEDLRRLADESPQQLQKSIADSNRFAADNPLNSDSVSRKWQDFMINLDQAGLTIKNALIDKLTGLEPNLEIMIKKFTELSVTVLRRIDWDALGKGLDNFTKFVSSEDFNADFKKFIDNVEAVAGKLGDLAKFLGWVPASTGGPAPSGVPSAGTAGLPSGRPQLGPGGVAGAVLFGVPGAIMGGLGSGYVGSGAFSMAAEQYIGQQFRKFGWSADQTKGLLENMRSESNFNPFAKGDRGAAYGLGQWHGDRQALYAGLFGHTMQSVKDPGQALREQLEFEQWELTSPDRQNHFKKAGDDLKRMQGSFASGYEVSMEYERPKGGRLTAAARGVAATVNVTLTNQTGASVATVVNSAAGG